MAPFPGPAPGEGYSGDSVANSLGDMLSGAAGSWRSVIVFAVTEVALLVWIRDSLLLNIVMLIHPVEAVRAWQAAL